MCLYSAPIEGIDSALSIGFPDENLYPFFVWPAGDFGYDPPLQAGEGNSAPPEWASELLSLHNAERVAPLAWSQVLAGIAQSHIDWCAAHGVLSHTGEEGRTTAERAAEAGYPYSVAENLVRGTIGDGAMQVWLADNEARSHIIDEGLTSVGFARALGTGDWADQWYVGALYGERHTSDVMAALELSALEGLDPDAEPRGVRLPMRLFIKRPGQTSFFRLWGFGVLQASRNRRPDGWRVAGDGRGYGGRAPGFHGRACRRGAVVEDLSRFGGHGL